MNIKDDHLYHGAALTQIAEDKRFTAINVLKVKGKPSRSAFQVNDDIAVYLKYASKPVGAFDEYVFTFNTANLAELNDINEAGDDLHLALVCVKAREICCISYTKLIAMIGSRRKAAGTAEDQYVILVTLEEGESFRVYINAPGKKKTTLSKPLIVARNKFPNALFR